MPIPLLIALILAFGFRLEGDGPPSVAEAIEQARDAALLLALLAAVAVALGRWIAWRVSRLRGSSSGLRRAHLWISRGLDTMNLLAFAGIVHGLDWPGVVARWLGPGTWILADEVLTFAPFVIGQMAVWVGLEPAERAIRARRGSSGGRVGPVRRLILKARATFGMVLPAALVFGLARDLLRLNWPDLADDPYVDLAGIAVMGGVVLTLAPAFIRLAWPTRSLPDGPLRHRLERLSRRLGFRCTDILVWDTGGGLVNAGVTGALPWFRYVLLTDALIAGLDEHQVEAVFGHEVGHIAHRHLGFFGFFFLGSFGAVALASQGVFRLVEAVPGLSRWLIDLVDRLPGLPSRFEGVALGSLVVEAGVTFGLLGLNFLLVFGYLSRRFERQADVFGCRAVSCGRPSCPPHADLNAVSGAPPARATPLCPVGIRIFADALATVASLNGMDPAARSWRHGSIDRRIGFLLALEHVPGAERRFQGRVHALRVLLAVLLVATTLAAIATGALENL